VLETVVVAKVTGGKTQAMAGDLLEVLSLSATALHIITTPTIIIIIHYDHDSKNNNNHYHYYYDDDADD